MSDRIELQTLTLGFSSQLQADVYHSFKIRICRRKIHFLSYFYIIAN